MGCLFRAQQTSRKCFDYPSVSTYIYQQPRQASIVAYSIARSPVELQQQKYGLKAFTAAASRCSTCNMGVINFRPKMLSSKMLYIVQPLIIYEPLVFASQFQPLTEIK